jgi:hypothetical protein
LLAADRYGAGWAAWGLSWMLKLQGAFVGPAMAILSLPRGLPPRNIPRLVGYGLAALVPIAVCWAPFLARGLGIGVFAGMRVNTQEDYLSANQANIWWLWSYIWEWNAEHKGPGVRVAIVPVSMIQEMGISDLNAWGIGLFLLLVIVTGAIWAWHRRGHLAAPLAVADLSLLPLQLYAATMLLPSIHENHLVPMLPLLALLVGLAAARGERLWLRRIGWLYGLLSVVVGLNLILFYGLGKGAPAPLPRMIAGFDSTVGLAAANVLIFTATLAVWCVALLRPARPAVPTPAVTVYDPA